MKQTNKVTYDSKQDTLQHIHRVVELLNMFELELMKRCSKHDETKLLDPEKETFDEFTPKLKDAQYMSDEYKSFLSSMQVALKHHYAENRHHPEHFENGIDGMTLVDVLEMFADWKAASERMKDGDIFKSIEFQKERFGISDQLTHIFENTAKEYFGEEL